MGNDIDLLAILIARGIPGTPLYFYGLSQLTGETKYYNISKTQEALLLLHAATGCDTTFATFRKGKCTAFKLIKENQELCSLTSQFNIPQLDPLKVIEIGVIFLKHLYGGKQNNSQEDLRHIRYNKVTKILSSKFKATLPSTSAAASFRVYLQVQQGLGNNLDPTAWGWFMKDGKLKSRAFNAFRSQSYFIHWANRAAAQGRYRFKGRPKITNGFQKCGKNLNDAVVSIYRKTQTVTK